MMVRKIDIEMPWLNDTVRLFDKDWELEGYQLVFLEKESKWIGLTRFPTSIRSE